MINCLMVGIGGFVGSILRYLIGLINVNEAFAFPVKTLCINVIGAFAIGLIAAVSARNSEFSPHIILLLKVGICGGFTTFSTFALETEGLMQEGRYLIAIAYILSSVILSIAAVFLGEALVK